MRKLLLLAFLVCASAIAASAQITGSPSGHIRYGSSLPATCKPGTGDVFFLTSGTVGMNECLSTNTWTAIGTGSGSGTVNAGTQFQLGYYATSAAAISGNSSLITDASGDLGIGQGTIAAKLDVLGGAAQVGFNVAGTAPTAVSSGNGTTSLNVLTVLGPAGGATSATTAVARGGNGAGISLTPGAGGIQSGASSGAARGGTGGSVLIGTGAGGNGTSATGVSGGGGSGSIAITTANGGTSLTTTGGTAGNISNLSGNGGVATAAAASGNGGAFFATGGNGGANATSGGTAGSGGAANVDSGVAGTASGGASAGANGNVNIGTANALAVNIGNATASTSTLIVSPQVFLSNAAYHSCTALTTNASGLIGCTASDLNLKENISAYSPGLVTILALRPKTYSFKPSWFNYNNGQIRAGFLAQDVQKVLPEAVSEFGPDHNLQIDSFPIIAAQTNAIQELSAKVDKLETQVLSLISAAPKPPSPVTTQGSLMLAGHGAPSFSQYVKDTVYMDIDTGFIYDQDATSQVYLSSAGGQITPMAVMATGSTPGTMSAVDKTKLNTYPSSPFITSATAPISVSSGALSVPNATNAQAGLLTSTDWTTFNGKQAALGFTPVANTTTVNGHALSGNVTVTTTDLGLGSAALREVRTSRVATGSISLGTAQSITVTFATPFADSNYTVQLQIEASGVDLFGVPILVSRSAASCVISVKNVSLSTQTATVHVFAIHD